MTLLNLLPTFALWVKGLNMIGFLLILHNNGYDYFIDTLL